MDNFVIGLIFDLVIFSIGYPVARLVLPWLSFGRAYARPPSSLEGGFNIFGYRRDGSGRIEIESTLAGSLGFVISSLCSARYLLLFSTQRSSMDNLNG